MSKGMSKNTKIFIAVVLVAALGLGLWYGIPYLISGSPVAPVPTSANSTFKLISAVDGEDVSNFVEISVWVPDSKAEFDEVEDIYTWSNFEAAESSKDAEDVSIDLSGIPYAWLEIDPDGEQVFANDHILLYGGSNFAYSIPVNHLTSDVNMGCVNSTGGATWGNFTLQTVAPSGNVPYGAMWVHKGVTYATGVIADNLTITLNTPEFTHANTHHGTGGWDIENSEYDDYSTAELEFHHDEANFRNQAPSYNPSVDTEKSGRDGLESITNGFAIKWTYNTTVSTTDAATTQVNMTIRDSKIDAEVVIDGTFIYIIFYGTIDFETAAYAFDIEYEEGKAIYATNVQTGRIVVPKDEDTLGAFTAYSTIGI
jgi:hypothetical protein